MRRSKILCVLMLAVSCTRIGITDEDDSSRRSQKETEITVRFRDGGDISSKSSFSNTSSEVSTLNLWVFRDGLLWDHCFSESPGEVTVKLMGGSEYSFYALANISEDLGEFPDEVSLAHLSLSMDLLNAGMDATGSFPMAGQVSLSFQKAQEGVTVPLLRLFSKIIFRFAPDEQLSAQNPRITAVRLRNSASEVTPFLDSSCAGTVSDSDADKASASDLTTINSGGPVEFYCLENCCGKNAESDSKKKTPQNAPYGQPTYVEVEMSLDGSQVSGNVTYRFCPGEDNYSDYNLVRDRIYDLTLVGLFDSISSGEDYWKLDSSGAVNNDGGLIRLYVGEFYKFDLSEGECLEVFDESMGRWQNFVNFEDYEDYSYTFDNGICLTTTYWAVDGIDCNSTAYAYSTASFGSSKAKVRKVLQNGDVEVYVFAPPVKASYFTEISDVIVCEDGYGNDSFVVDVSGSLGQKSAGLFAIPDGYEYADIPYSRTGTDSYSYFKQTSCTLPAHLLQEWKLSFDTTAQINSALKKSKQWSLFKALYISGFESSCGELTSDMGCYFDCLNNPSLPRLVFYGLQEGSGDILLENNVFSQNVGYHVAKAFPKQGFLGEIFNYNLAPNSLAGTDGFSLPSGISSKAKWTVDGNEGCMSVSSTAVKFNFRDTRYASIPPSSGHYMIEGSVTNPFSSEVKSGSYTFDVILYLPLMASVKVVDSAYSSSSIETVPAVGSVRYYYDSEDMWLDILSRIFNKAVGFKVTMSLSSNQISAYSEYWPMALTVPYAVDVSSYTPSWLASYAPVHLDSFRDVSGKSLKELNIYPSASSSIKTVLESISSPVYAKVVIMNNVNTNITPVVNTYGQGQYIYECLWGQISQ